MALSMFCYLRSFRNELDLSLEVETEELIYLMVVYLDSRVLNCKKVDDR